MLPLQSFKLRWRLRLGHVAMSPTNSTKPLATGHTYLGLRPRHREPCTGTVAQVHDQAGGGFVVRQHSSQKQPEDKEHLAVPQEQLFGSKCLNALGVDAQEQFQTVLQRR